MTIGLLIVGCVIAYAILGCVTAGACMAGYDLKPYNHMSPDFLNETSNHAGGIAAIAVFWPVVVAVHIIGCIGFSLYWTGVKGPGKLITSIGYKFNPSLKENK